MKINKNIIIPVFLLVILTGCQKDFLDMTPLDQIDPNAYFNNEKEASVALNGVYSALDDTWISYDAMSDDMIDQYPWEGPFEIGNGTYGSETDYILWKWQYSYKGIARANLFIEKMETVATFDADVKNRMIGEAKFLRAFWYADLADFYGDVPLITAPQSLEEASTPKSPKAEVITQVLKDLDDAAATLPGSYSGGDIGRATKGAALALKTRVLLYNQRWSEAAAVAKTITGYSLYPDYAGLFTVEAENNEEIIFDSQYIKDKRVNGYSTIIRDWKSFCPFKQLSDDYYMANGKPITAPGSGFDALKPFENRDPRLKQTLGLPGEDYGGAIYIPADDQNSPTGMAIKKWVEFSNDEYWNSEINLILIRYADVLLMYAEAQNEASGPDASVYEAMNSVRERAGMPDVTPGLDQAQMRNEIRHERRIEFVGEGLRYSDIRRWHIAENVLVNGTGYDRNLLADPTDPSNWVYEEIVVDERTFSAPKNYIWPLPESELTVNKALVQNPLW
jgi:starch-binding outer membrane protein, SusD/RagB family